MTEANRPEQLPGDAESPPKGTEDPVVKDAMGHTDQIEPVQSEQTPKNRNKTD